MQVPKSKQHAWLANICGPERDSKKYHTLTKIHWMPRSLYAEAPAAAAAAAAAAERWDGLNENSSAEIPHFPLLHKLQTFPVTAAAAEALNPGRRLRLRRRSETERDGRDEM